MNQAAPAPAPMQPSAVSAGHKPAPKPSVIGAWGPRIVLIAVGAVTLISIGFVLFGASGDAIGRIIFTDLALIAFGLLVWLDALIGRYRADWFEVTSMAADAYTLLIWVGIIWLGEPSGFDVFLGFYVFIIIRLALLHLDLVRWLMTKWDSQINRIIGGIAIGSISAFFIMLTLPCLSIFEHFWDIDIYGRIVASLAILGSMSTILIPLTALLYNRKPKNLGAPRPVAAAPAGYGSGAGAPAGYGADVPTSSPAPAPIPVQPAAVQDAASSVIGTPPAAVPEQAPAAASTGHMRAWPSLADGTPLPPTVDGAPDFAAVRPDQQLAWPTYVDGSPVPAGPDGSPVAAD